MLIRKFWHLTQEQDKALAENQLFFSMKLFSLFFVVLGASANLTDKLQCPTTCVEDGSVDYFPDKVIVQFLCDRVERE